MMQNTHANFFWLNKLFHCFWTVFDPSGVAGLIVHRRDALEISAISPRLLREEVLESVTLDSTLRELQKIHRHPTENI